MTAGTQWTTPWESPRVQYPGLQDLEIGSPGEIRAQLPPGVLALFRSLGCFSGWNWATLGSLCRQWRGNGQRDPGPKASLTVCRDDASGSSEFWLSGEAGLGARVRPVLTGPMGEWEKAIGESGYSFLALEWVPLFLSNMVHQPAAGKLRTPSSNAGRGEKSHLNFLKRS